MANVRSGNSFYVDTAGVLNTLGVKVFYIVVTPTGTTPTVVLGDAGSGDLKIELRAENAKPSSYFDFSRNPLWFGGGMEVVSITNCIVTIVYNDRGG